MHDVVRGPERSPMANAAWDNGLSRDYLSQVSSKVLD